MNSKSKKKNNQKAEAFLWEFDPEMRSIPYATLKSERSDDLFFQPKIYVELIVRGCPIDPLIELTQLQKRAEPDFINGGREALYEDLRTRRFQSFLLDRDGLPINQLQLDELKSFPLTRLLREADSEAQLSDEVAMCAYQKLWATTFKEALDWGAEKNRRHWKRSKGKYDVLSRFFTLEDGAEVPMYLLFNEAIDPRAIDFKTLWEKYCVNRIIVTGVEQLDPTCKEWFSHPLGLYKAWVDETTYNYLVKAQTGGNCAEWEFPNKGEVERFNNDLITKNFKSLDLEVRRLLAEPSVPRVFQVHPVQHGEKLSSFKRFGTGVIMGGSANQWAINHLGWTSPYDTVVAEWLHMIAHRFENNTGDRASNMFFGTKACNTNMMRTEAAVTQLAASNKIHELLVSTELTGLPELDTMRYVRWVGAALGYSIQYQTKQSGWPCLNSPINVFNPFLKLYPLRFEYELDNVVTQQYLDHMEEGLQPFPFESLLKNYKMEYDPDEEEEEEDEEEETDDEDIEFVPKKDRPKRTRAGGQGGMEEEM